MRTPSPASCPLLAAWKIHAVTAPTPGAEGGGRVAGPCSLPLRQTYSSFPVMWSFKVSHLPRCRPPSFESDPRGLAGPQLESCCHRMSGMEVRWQNSEAPLQPPPSAISRPGIFSQLLCSGEKPAPQTQPWSDRTTPAVWPRVLGAGTNLVPSFNTFRRQSGCK